MFKGRTRFHFVWTNFSTLSSLKLSFPSGFRRRVEEEKHGPSTRNVNGSPYNIGTLPRLLDRSVTKSLTRFPVVATSPNSAFSFKDWSSWGYVNFKEQWQTLVFTMSFMSSNVHLQLLLFWRNWGPYIWRKCCGSQRPNKTPSMPHPERGGLLE